MNYHYFQMPSLAEIAAAMRAAQRDRRREQLDRYLRASNANLIAIDAMGRDIKNVRAYEREEFDSELDWGTPEKCEKLYFQHHNASMTRWNLHKSLAQNLEALPVDFWQKIVQFRTRSRENSPPYDGVFYGFLMDVKAIITREPCHFEVEDVIQIGVTPEQRENCGMFIVVHAQLVRQHAENKTFKINIFTCRNLK